MYSSISVTDKTASVHVYSGWGDGPHIRLVGSTIPIVPAGTVIDKLSVKIPDSLHGIAFFCRVEGPHREGSGKTAYLSHAPKLSASILLSWREGGKLFVKADSEMKAAELARFNSFVRSDTDIYVVDTQGTIAYVSNLPRDLVDPTWTYKSVSMEAILEYITKKLTLEELDERATSEERARDELQELREQNGVLSDTIRQLTSEVGGLATTISTQSKIIETLEGSRRLYELLKRLPAKFRPKAFDGFVGAMDLLN